MAVATVIGGSGRMGTWFATFLKRNGYHIIIYDKNKRAAKNLAKRKRFRFVDNLGIAVQTSQLVILATPTNVTKYLLEKIEPKLRSGAVLVEISSIKEPVRSRLEALARRGIDVLSIHPMFGAGVKNLVGKTVITTLLPKRNARASNLLSLFRRDGAQIIKSDFVQHDKFASIILALPHFMNIAMVNTLQSQGLTPNELRATAGTSFKLQLLIAESIYQEGFVNEASILTDSKHSLNVLRMFVNQSVRTLAVLSKGRRANLLHDLRKGRTFLLRDAMFGHSYARFNAAVEASNLG